MAISAFGKLLRAKRMAAGLSLRQVATAVGVSHVFLGEVERGVRSSLKADHWPGLLAAVPGLTPEELERAAATSGPLKLSIAEAPPAYQDLALALARRLQRQDLKPSEMQELIALLKGGEDE